MKNARSQKMMYFLILITSMLLLISGCISDPSDEGNELSISGIVFLDANGNGSMDSDESGIANIVITSQTDETQTNAKGEFTLNTQLGEDQISVQKSSLPEGSLLTTANDTQSFTIEESITADAIGYTNQNSSSNFVFGDLITNPSFINNYYFELIMTNAGQSESSMKLWVIDNNMKAETQGMITYYNQENGTMGVYTSATNQVVITPILEMMPILTPFTFIEELDPNTFEAIMFKGEEMLDGKEVLVFENSMPGFEVTYYIWKDYQLIIKMDTKTGDMTSGFYFKDLSLDTVTMEDINYPSGAEVLDLS